MATVETMNRHPVDALADVRSEIKKLQETEAQLRELILQGKCDQIGDNFIASITETKTARLDVKTAKAKLGSILTPFMIETTIRTVRVHCTRAEDEAA